MDEKESRGAFMSALTTEHFVMQTVIGTTNSEAASRASIYVFSLSSSLVAMGFVVQSPDAFLPFVAIVLPTVFMLGVFTILRLIDIAAENMLAYIAIARVRERYRSINDEAAQFFAAECGRWPENMKAAASLRAGPVIGYLTAGAVMIAFVNAMLGAATLALLSVRLLGVTVPLAVLLGLVLALVFLAMFFFYQRFRIDELARPAQSMWALKNPASKIS
jgi:hypothetical protein